MDENTVRRRSIAIPRLQPVETDADIERLAKLAHEIWFEYWPAHIGEVQTRYMVERFQTAEAIRRDMASSAYEYWFVLAPDDGRVVGYTGGRAEPKTGRFFISQDLPARLRTRPPLRQRRDRVLRGFVPRARPARHVPYRQQG